MGRLCDKTALPGQSLQAVVTEAIILLRPRTPSILLPGGLTRASLGHTCTRAQSRGARGSQDTLGLLGVGHESSRAADAVYAFIRVGRRDRGNRDVLSAWPLLTVPAAHGWQVSLCCCPKPALQTQAD